MSTLTIVFAAISAVGGLGGLAAFAYVAATRRKLNAEARKLEVEPDVLLSQQAMEMYDRLRSELKETRTELRAEQAKNERVEAHVRDLEEVLRRHGITPPRWPPLGVVNGDA